MHSRIGLFSLRLNGERIVSQSIVERILTYAKDHIFVICKMARASNDVSRIVCANTIQENKKRLLEARIKNQVLRHKVILSIYFTTFRNREISNDQRYHSVYVLEKRSISYTNFTYNY